MKRLRVFGFFGFLFLITLFHQLLLTYLAAGFLHIYSISKWDQPLEYEKISLKGSQLEILQPHLKNDPSFAAERIIINFHINWWKRHLHLDIEIDNPQWHFQTPVLSQWEKWEKLGRHHRKWIKVYPHFRIKAGLLTWVLEDSSVHQVHFNLEANRRKGGFIKLYFHPQEHTTNFVALQTLSAADEMEVTCNCHKVEGASLVALAQFLGMDVPRLLVTSGSLHGELKARFPEKKRPYLEGELLVEQLTFNHSETSLKGHVEQARLILEKNQSAYEKDQQVPTIMGKLDILKPASLTCYSLAQNWTLHQIKGSVQLNHLETAFIDLEAQARHSDHSSHWKMQGRANLNAQRSLDLDLTLISSSLGESEGKLHLSLHQLQEENKHAKVQVENFSPIECDFLQTFLAMRWPVFNQIKLEKGKLHASVEAVVTNQGLGELHVKQFQAFHVCSKFPSWNIKCDFEEIRGEGKIDLGREDFWQSVNANLHLEEGEIELEGLTPLLPLTDIQAHVLIQQGHVENSLINLQLAGLKGKMDVDWDDHRQLLVLKLDGRGQDIVELLPNALQEGLRQSFYHNQIMLYAYLKRQNQHIEVEGFLDVQRENTDCMDRIQFGCELKRIEEHFLTRRIPSGWFYAQHLALENFLSPFIFPDGKSHISGEAELKGVFNDHYLTLQYNAKDLKIDNEDLCIEIQNLQAPVAGQLLGSHQIDLTTYSHQGTLPLQHATYLEKNSGLIFQDIQGLVTFNQKLIRILPLEAYCEGIYLAGELELDYQDPAPGVFKLMIHCPTLSAKVSQIQHVLAHFQPSSFLHKIPLEGEVTTKKEGVKLHFSFLPQDYQLQAEVGATLTDGSLPFEEADIALKGIDMDIYYHHQQQLLAFNDIQGTLLVGKPRRVKEFLLTGDHIHICQIAQPDIQVDLVVKDEETEILRVVGYTEQVQEDVKRLHLNQSLSHLSHIYPQVWQCQLREWSSIEQFNFRSSFDWGRVLQDLGRFRQTGLLCLSHCLLDRIAEFLPVEGEGLLVVCHQPDHSYTYSLEGSHIKQASGGEHQGFLKGSKKDKKWLIDQLQWDDWNAYAEVQQTDAQWKIPFLGLNVGKTLLLGLEGELFGNESRLQAKLKFCELNLATLDGSEFLKSLVRKWSPQGILKATGTIEWNFLSPTPWEGLQASLEAEINDLSIRNYPLQVLHPFLLEWQAGQQLIVQDIALELVPKSGKTQIDLKKLAYCIPQNHLNDLQLFFQLPTSHLEIIGQSLHQHFPEFLDAMTKDLLVTIKQQGSLVGSLTVENQKPHQHFLRLKLEDGFYTFKKRDMELKQFELQLLGDEVKFSAFSQQERCSFQIVGQSKWPCQQGQCQLISSDISQPLVIKWYTHPQRGCMIRSMQGEWGGCSFCLEEDKDSLLHSEWTAMQGQVKIDFNRLSPLLTSEIAETIQKLKIGSLYRFIGRFWINLDRGNTLLDILSFKGQLMSEEAILKGYQIQNLQSDFQYVPGRLDMQHLSMQDCAGSLKCDNLIAIRDNQEEWKIFIPHLTVKNLKMNLLRAVVSPPYAEKDSKLRSLMVKRLEVQDFSGDLDHRNTWRAKGNLHFLNPSRKNIHHPLLAIPAEIILRLGLDPHVLNPVTGTIYFDLREDRFYLTRFKDVYSEGRGSKFYLVQGDHPSWMDFDGHLSVQVGMKQSNLLFKLAELFTVSIQGNIKNPRYTLQKQSKTLHKAHVLSEKGLDK